MPQYVKSHDISGSFWAVADKTVPRSGMHCSTPTNATHLRYAALTRMIPHSFRVKLLHVYRSLLSLCQSKLCLFHRSASWHCLHRAHFWSACLSLIFCKFLAGVSRIVVGQVNSLHRFGYGPAWDRTRASVLKVRRLTARDLKHKQVTACQCFRVQCYPDIEESTALIARDQATTTCSSDKSRIKISE